MSTKFGIMMQSGYSSAHTIRKIIEKLNFKYPRWQTADVLKKPILIRYHEFSIFKIAAVHCPGFFKIKIFSSYALHRQAASPYQIFGDSHSVLEALRFLHFLVVHSPGDRA